MIQNDIYKKSYLLEVIEDNKVTDAFCFSVPPESEEFTHGQRMSQTKTYGGLCVDRYGREVVKISLSGSTINQEVKYIYRSSLPAKNLTGEQEIYELRDLLNSVSDNEGAELRLYDLSKSVTTKSAFTSFKENGKRLTQTFTDTKTVKNYWTVYLENFRIKRDKSRPLTYTYQLEFTGIPFSGKKDVFQTTTIKTRNLLTGITETIQVVKNSTSAITTSIRNSLSEMRNGLKACREAYEKANKMIDSISVVSKAVDEFESIFSDYADVLTGLSTLPKKAVKQVVNVGKTIVKSSTNMSLDVGRSLIAAAQGLKDSVSVFKLLEEEIKNTDPETLYSQEKLNALQTSIEELTNSAATAANEVIDRNNEIQANLTKLVIPVLVINTDENGDDYFVITYGSKNIRIKEGDSLEKLSYEYYGTTEYVTMLENFNGLSDDNLSIGMEFKIPLLEPDPSNLNNDIYDTNSASNLGSDLKLDEYGNLCVYGGDLAIISDKENLDQAINSRLTAYMGSNVRNVIYGIRNTIGQNEASNAYLLASMEQTLLQEPRIKSIDDISYKGMGENISVVIKYTDINDNQYEFKGVA